jgi:molybdopterin molybdotransferase
MKTFIGFKDALELTLSNVSVGKPEIRPLDELTGRILSENLFARVDCPSSSTSRKDGFAVNSDDLTDAGEQHPVRLDVIGSMVAGGHVCLKMTKGQTIRVTTGAPLPDGANAVLSEEFCRPAGNQVIAFNTAEPGRNIHARGADICQGETLVEKDTKLAPALLGLLAAAGLDCAPVYKYPKVAIIATGDEVVLPGKPLPQGKLYASNLVEIRSWLNFLGFESVSELVPDHYENIGDAVNRLLPRVDMFITSGGAWGSERDLILQVVERLEWQGIYHRVRMGPGKPVGFGLLQSKPFFCLPGGPPSNEMAFLQLVLPALLKTKGEAPYPFALVRARLAETVCGKHDWTDFIHARIETRDGQLWVHPARLTSMLKSMAQKEALIQIPEGLEEIPAGESVEIQLLRYPCDSLGHRLLSLKKVERQ